MQKSCPNRSARRPTSSLLLPAVVTLCFAATLAGQSFPSGSTGADGALNITAPGVTTTLPAPVGGGNIYNFTTINIATGSTLKLSAAVFPGPIYFLATGAVTIAGTIDLSGQGGSTPTTSAQRTAGPTIPGAGGYGGGSAGFGAYPALTGLGPLGGAVSGGCYGGSAGGGFSGNQFLVPLVGGSGGGGNASGSGGAGGGALLIASSASITVTGTITVDGGNGSSGSGAGAGGGVRLVAPSIAGNGAITAAAGSPNSGNSNFCNGGANGTVRLESYLYSFTGTTGGTFYTATPVNLFLPTANAQPSIMVTSIGGVAVPANPTGTFTVPDVVLNSSAPVTMNIKASNIPLGTIPTVYFITENFPNQTIAANAGLGGTVASSTATATVTLNPGYTVGYVVANWTQ
jgi:hypothetical protein